jgi:hypothetical protein
MNYYLDKTVSINGTLIVNGSVINIKSEKTFNTYTDLIELTLLVDSNKEIKDVYVPGNLIIREYEDINLNVIGNYDMCEIITLE